MYIWFWALLMSSLILLLRSKHALAMADSVSRNSFVEAAFLSYGGIPTSGWEGTDDILADGTGAFLDSSVRASSNQVATESTKLSTSLGAEAFGSRQAKRGFLPAFALRSLGTALGLLFFAGLLTLGWKRQAARAPLGLSAAKEPVAVISGLELSDDERIAEAMSRLEKVKGLLPAASRLASAVNSAESEKLLAEVQQVIARSAEVKMDRKQLEGSVTIALKALQKLQQTAIEGAAAILQADSSLVNFSSLRPWEKKSPEAMSDLEQGIQQATVRSFVSLYKSFYANEVCLCQRSAQVADKISTQERFENETHGERLLTTAIAVEAVQDISAWKRGFSVIEGPLSKGVVCATKFVLLAERDGAMKDFERCRDYLRVGVALQKNEEEAALKPLDGADKPVLDYLKQSLETLDSNMKQLRDDTEAVKTSTTLEAAIVAGLHAASLEQQTRDLIRKSAVYLEPSFAASADLTDSDTELVAEAAINAHQDVVLGCVGLLLNSKDLRETLERCWGEVSACGRQHLNAAMGELLLEEAFRLEAQAKQRVEDSKWAVLQLGKTKAIDAAMNLLKAVNSGALLQIHDKNTAELLSLGGHLLVLLEDDVRATVDRVDFMVSKGYRLSGAAKLKYKEAEKKFNAAREAAAKAPTLWEAAEAAAELRTHALAMQALLFSFKESEGGI